jgi:Fe-S oxidoreductase
VEATGSEVVDLSRGGRADVLLLLDATAPYDRGAWPALAASVRLVRAAGLTVGTLGAEEIATGLPVLAAGDVSAFLRLNHEAVQRVAAAARRAGVRQVVAIDDTGFQAWTSPRKHYGLAGALDFPFAHLIPFLVGLVEEGRLRLTRRVDREVALLDACHLGRYCKVLEAPRALLARVPGLRVQEAHLRREYLYCCGAAAGVAEAYPEQAASWGRKRLAQGVEVLTAGRTVVTTSPVCGAHLRPLAAGRGEAEVKDLVEIAAEAIA